MNRYMMATKAQHKMGDISRCPAQICLVSGEDEMNYIGRWLTGFGFCNVQFPKSTTRELTAEEAAEYNGQMFGIPGGATHTVRIPSKQ